MTGFTNIEKLRELERELTYRKRVYTRLVAEGRLQQEIADRRVAILHEIAADYASRVEQDEPKFAL